MADKKISALTPLTSTEVDLNADFIPIVDGGTETKKINPTNLMESKSFNTVALAAGGTGYIGGDQGGHTRGSGALDIQSERDGDARIAEGVLSLTVGSNCLVDADKSYAVGRQNFIHARNSTAVGELNDIESTAAESFVFGRNVKVSGARSLAYGRDINISNDSTDSVSFGKTINVANNADGSIAMGNDINMSGENSVSLGLNLDISGDNSAAIGRNVKVNTNAVSELGSWYSNGSRGTSVRLSNIGNADNPTGTVAFSLANKTASQLDGGTVAGSETVDSLPREMVTIRRNGDEVLADVNIAGTVKTVSFGDATRVGAGDATSARTSVGSAIQNRRDDTAPINTIRRMTQGNYNTLANANPSQVDANTLYIIIGA